MTRFITGVCHDNPRSMSGEARSRVAITKDMPGQALSADLFTLLSQVRDALQGLPAVVTNVPEIRSIAVVAKAGPVGARGVVEAAGGAAVAGALLKASATFRSTGHFHNADLLERFAFVVAGWERRARPRRAGR